MLSKKLKNEKAINCNDVLNKFQKITKEPEEFLRPQLVKCAKINELMQQVYKMCTICNFSSQQTAEVLPELVLDGMDDEQIWQQLDLSNNAIFPQFIEQIAKLLALREQKLEIQLKEEGTVDSEQSDELDNELVHEFPTDETNLEELETEEDESADEYQNNAASKALQGRKLRPSVVDDKFFKLDEMAAFLEVEDAKEMQRQKFKYQQNDDGIDYFSENLGDAEDDNENLNYKDFFDDEEQGIGEGNETETKVKQKDYFHDSDEFLDESKETSVEVKKGTDTDMNKEDSVDSDMEAVEADEHSNELKSNFELRHERLLQRIRNFEEEMLGDKPWQLKGEVQGTKRPQNSLLEEILEFENTTRPAPLVTEETTQRLEDIIRQRIKDQAWDDVVRVVRQVQTPHEYRKQLVLDQEKSKESLAQIYEKEYQREVEKLGPNRGADTTEEEPAEHQKIRDLTRKLFTKLDALSNFHFVPKPVAPEAKIITNRPALTMEEITPAAMTSASLLAPEEVHRGPKSELIGKSERNRTDKNRERRNKKQKQRAIYKSMEAKNIQREKLGIPLSKKEESAKLLKSITNKRNVEKVTVSKDKGQLKSSKSFFSKLQDTTTGAAANTKRKINHANIQSVKQLKL